MVSIARCCQLAAWLALLAGPLAVGAEHASAPVKTPSDAWPVFRGNPASSGVAGSELPERPVVLWKKAFPRTLIESTAAIADGTVYVGLDTGELVAVDLQTGDTRWEKKTPLGFKAPAAVRSGRVFIGDLEGEFYCFDAASGELKWQRTTDAEISSGANFYRDQVLIGSQDGSLYCLRVETGELVWQYTIDDMIQCSPTVVENRAFLAGCDGKLHIIDLDRGEAAATVDIGDPTGATPAVLGDMVYFGTQGATVFGVQWREAQVVWTYRSPQRKQPYQSSAAVGHGVVVLGGRDRLVHALDAATGEQKWTFPTRSAVDCSPVIVGKRVFFGSGDGRLYALDLATGEDLWQYEAGAGFASSPAVAAGRLVIGNDDGELFCFGAK